MSSEEKFYHLSEKIAKKTNELFVPRHMSGEWLTGSAGRDLLSATSRFDRIFSAAVGQTKKHLTFVRCFFVCPMLDMVAEIGTFWKLDPLAAYLPNLKDGLYPVVRPTSEELMKYESILSRI